MKYFLYPLALEENSLVSQHAFVFEGEEPPKEFTLRQMASAYHGQIMVKHRHEIAEKMAAMDDNQLHDYLCSEGPTFTHGVWIVESLSARMNFMAAELEDYPVTTDSEMYAFGDLWANTLKKYAYRGEIIAFPQLDIE